MPALNAENLTATYPAGATLAQIAADLQPFGLFWPGGRVLAPSLTLRDHLDGGIAGPWRLAWGTSRDWVLGLTVRTPDGVTVRLGGSTVKNVAGLDLTKLFIGARGALGEIREATLRLSPLPDASVTLGADFAGGPVAASAALPGLLGSRLQPAAVDFVSPGRLLVALEGTRADLPRRSGEAAACLQAAGGTVAAGAAAAEAALWAERAGRPAEWVAMWGGTAVRVRCGVPAARGAQLLEAARTVLADRPWATEAHAGSGIWRLYTPATDLPALAAALAGLRQAVAALEGYLLIEEGPPALAEHVPFQAPHPADALAAAVRSAVAGQQLAGKGEHGA